MYNAAMPRVPERYRLAFSVLKVLLVVAIFVGANFKSYELGYRKGSGEIIEPRRALRLLNPTWSGTFSIQREDGPNVDFSVFWKTWNILDKNFVPSATSTDAKTIEARVAGAIDGLVRSYDDPYTVLIAKKDSAAFMERVDAQFEGIGAGLKEDNGSIVVTGLLPDSPALRAGLKVGDRIIAIDDVPTQGQALSAVIPHIRGPKESVVVLTIIPAKTQKEVAMPITRGTIVIPTTATRIFAAARNVVESAAAKAVAAAAASLPGPQKDAKIAAAKERAAQIAQQQFFVLQLASFAKTSVDAFIVDLKKFSRSNTKNLIIDLRHNPGGYLEVAVDLASYFLPKDTVVVTEKTGALSIVTEHRSRGYPLLEGSTSTRRIVVLLNHNSASASEILAGALQDHRVAKVVGETSFGKGSVQSLIDIGDIGSLKITIARWYTPSGRNISHTGITPDVVVDLKDPKYASSTDPYMDAAVETLLDDSLW